MERKKPPLDGGLVAGSMHVQPPAGGGRVMLDRVYIR
jgi:hypothetical protein